MKIYLHINFNTLTNCYLIVNEREKRALIIDPCNISTDIIKQIEDGGYTLEAALITHKHKNHTSGLSTLKKIYNVEIFAADMEISSELTILKDNGKIKVAGFDVEYFSLLGHSTDSIVYKIGTALFTGDVICAGRIGSSPCNYTRIRLCNEIQSKLFVMPDEMVIMPGHGPFSSIGTEKQFNLDINGK